MDTGTSLHIQAHNDSTVKVCVDNDTLITGASGVTEMHTSGTGTTGVKIYFDEADGDRWYLRVYLNSADEEVVELVSQSYINNVSTDKHTQCCGLCNVIVFESLVIIIPLPDTSYVCELRSSWLAITILVCVCRLRTRVLKFLLSWRRYSLTSKTSQHPLCSSRLRENMSCPVYTDSTALSHSNFYAHFIIYVTLILYIALSLPKMKILKLVYWN